MTTKQRYSYYVEACEEMGIEPVSLHVYRSMGYGGAA